MPFVNSVFTKAQTSVPFDRKDWILVGSPNAGTDPYDYLYWKIMQVNNDADRYASILLLSIQTDANFYNQQGTYEIRIDKCEHTTGGFDGVEIRCVSGNPAAGLFYVFNNTIWVRSAFKWGTIYMRTVGDFGSASPKVPAFSYTVAAPAGAAVVAQYFGVKCDFDNNVINKLPYTDVLGNLSIGGNYAPPAGDPVPKLAGNGTLAAKRVKVTQSGWADFVFDPGYELPSLSFVEQYIKTYKHLPEIPSVNEIEQNGHDLGEMNRKLLQKIEELTLYIIEMKKENKQQQEVIEQLQKKVPDAGYLSR